MRVRRGSPSWTTADTIACPSGVQLGLPCSARESARTLACEPSLSIIYNSILPLSLTVKTMRRPSGARAGPPTTREFALPQSSRAAPCVNDHMPCLSPRHDTYKSKSAPNLGVAAFAATGKGLLATMPAVESCVSDMRQTLVRELAIVAARRAPSALAASDV